MCGGGRLTHCNDTCGVISLNCSARQTGKSRRWSFIVTAADWDRGVWIWPAPDMLHTHNQIKSDRLRDNQPVPGLKSTSAWDIISAGSSKLTGPADSFLLLLQVRTWTWFSVTLTSAHQESFLPCVEWFSEGAHALLWSAQPLCQHLINAGCAQCHCCAELTNSVQHLRLFVTVIHSSTRHGKQRASQTPNVISLTFFCTMSLTGS